MKCASISLLFEICFKNEMLLLFLGNKLNGVLLSLSLHTKGWITKWATVPVPQISRDQQKCPPYCVFKWVQLYYLIMII